MVQIFWRSVYFQFFPEKWCFTSTLALCKPLQVQWRNTHIIFLPSMDSKSYSSNLSSFVQPPYSGSPFNLVSGEDFSSPSRVMDKVQRVDHADQNVAWNHYIHSSRMISLIGHSWGRMNYAMVYSSDERISTSRSQGLIGSGRNLFCLWIPFGFKLKNTHLTFEFILRGQGSGLNFLFFLSMKLT